MVGHPITGLNSQPTGGMVTRESKNGGLDRTCLSGFRCILCNQPLGRFNRIRQSPLMGGMSSGLP
jgi:hypothetical protein